MKAGKKDIYQVKIAQNFFFSLKPLNLKKKKKKRAFGDKKYLKEEEEKIEGGGMDREIVNFSDSKL